VLFVVISVLYLNNVLIASFCAFSDVVASSICNSLPLAIYLQPKSYIPWFCKLLKTYLYHRDWPGRASE